MRFDFTIHADTKEELHDALIAVQGALPSSVFDAPLRGYSVSVTPDIRPPVQAGAAILPLPLRPPVSGSVPVPAPDVPPLFDPVMDQDVPPATNQVNAAPAPSGTKRASRKAAAPRPRDTPLDDPLAAAEADPAAVPAKSPPKSSPKSSPKTPPAAADDDPLGLAGTAPPAGMQADEADAEEEEDDAAEDGEDGEEDAEDGEDDAGDNDPAAGLTNADAHSMALDTLRDSFQRPGGSVAVKNLQAKYGGVKFAALPEHLGPELLREALAIQKRLNPAKTG